jgi:hypothetical protein
MHALGVEGPGRAVLGVPATTAVGIPAASSKPVAKPIRTAAVQHSAKGNHKTTNRNQEPGHAYAGSCIAYDYYTPWMLDDLWLNAAWAQHCSNTG